MRLLCLCFGLSWCLSSSAFTSAAGPADEGLKEIVVTDEAPGDEGTEGRDQEKRGEADDAESESVFQPASTLLLQPPLEAVVPRVTTPTPAPTSANLFAQGIFAAPDVRQSLLSDYRRSLAQRVGTELVFGSEGKFRVTSDGGNLLGKSLFAPAVDAQQRTPVVTDTRVRAMRTGRLLASGSYWVPARDDLDTMLSKIDSRTIHDVIVIGGPYSVRYGPGFSFIDFELLESPRYRCGFQTEGSTSAEYKTNGEQFYGRQTIWGGDSDWGFRVGYGHRTGNDYRTGAGFELPTSYNSRDWDVAIGFDPSCDTNLEFHYLRLDQTNVEFPGLVFDINFLVTDAYELTYTAKDQPHFDLFTVSGWYNRTRFEGDTSRPGKNLQIPSLRPELGLARDQFAVTDVDSASAGYRIAATWGDPGCCQWTLGTDLTFINQQLNDIVPGHEVPFVIWTAQIPERNYPIPRSHSTDVGLFVDHTRPVNECLTLNMGARVDVVTTDAREWVPGMGEIAFPPFPWPNPVPVELVEMGLSDIKEADLEQSFTPWAVFATLERKLNCCWTLTAGAGHAVRPPTLTELYADRPFIGSLQPGLTFVEGDPELDPERCTQVDLGMRADYGCFRMNLNGFYAWIDDYITYDFVVLSPLPPEQVYTPGEDLQQVAFVNTDLATLTGFELLAEQDVNCWLTAFGVMSYVEGRDLARNDPSRIGSLRRIQGSLPAGPRSEVAGVDSEPLPGIPPLDTRVGLRLHEPGRLPSWAIEFEARLVAAQDRVASTLFEQPTSGFAVGNIRSYWQAKRNLLLIAGVENFTDTFYREHLDYRSGRGVWQPGVSFYFSSELTY